MGKLLTILLGMFFFLLIAAAPSSAHSADSSERSGELAAEAAEEAIGAKYKWSGDGPKEFDCSGLVVWAYEQVGVTSVPRSSIEQYRHTDRISKSELRPGDLVFWSYGKRNGVGKTDHVGMYVGDGYVIDARPSKGGVTKQKLDDVWTKPIAYGRLPT